MDNWRTYPQEMPEVGREVALYSISDGDYCSGDVTHQRGRLGVLDEWMFIPLESGDMWRYHKSGYILFPPPHSPAHPNDTPLVETATATADNDDEITADKLVSIGFSPDTPWLYSRETRSDTFIVFDKDDNSICLTNGDGTINITAHVTTMTELRTLIRWLS